MGYGKQNRNKESGIGNNAPIRIQNPHSKIESFHDLHAWQEAHQLVLMTYALTKKFPKDELFALVSQMRRAAVSITSNIAEGFGRSSYKEKAYFYSIAQGSVTELQNQFYLSRDLGYIDVAAFEKTEELAIRVHKITHGLIRGARKTIALLLLLIPVSYSGPLFHL